MTLDQHEEERALENCACGAARKQYWIWRDANGEMHASGFEPSSGVIRSVIAASVRDALLPLTGGGTPKHSVSDADDPSIVWTGRCKVASAVG